ncbi:MAG: hypothetical protein IPK59_02680 [Rhodospirillaceae bacterium]|nr:hypothetical protein [Rhodospirillaceae bacterium]
MLLAVLTTFVIGWLGIWLRSLMKREADKAERLSEALIKAESASESKSEFLANMSHELRTPLNAIIGFSEVLSRETYGPLGARQYRDYSKDICDAGHHLLGIITQILDMAKIESGTLTNSTNVADLADNFDACNRLLSGKAEERQIEIVLGALEGLPPVGWSRSTSAR